MPRSIVALSFSLILCFTSCSDDNNGEGPVEPACEAGARECTDDGLRTCAADGTWGVADPCPATEICHVMG